VLPSIENRSISWGLFDLSVKSLPESLQKKPRRIDAGCSELVATLRPIGPQLATSLYNRALSGPKEMLGF
jgi:hypothetical protein